MHRLPLVLKQQSSTTVYHLPTKEYKLLFLISVHSKSKEIAVPDFPFKGNK
jgi:hypothetical protein